MRPTQTASTPARTATIPTPARFGEWRVERAGLRHVRQDYLIPRAELWDGPLSGEPEHNDWIFHLRGRHWVNMSDLRRGLAAARQYHAKYCPTAKGGRNDR